MTWHEPNDVYYVSDLGGNQRLVKELEEAMAEAGVEHEATPCLLTLQSPYFISVQDRSIYYSSTQSPQTPVLAPNLTCW